MLWQIVGKVAASKAITPASIIILSSWRPIRFPCCHAATAANALSCAAPEQAWLLDPAPTAPAASAGSLFGAALPPPRPASNDWDGGDQAMLDSSPDGRDGSGDLGPTGQQQQQLERRDQSADPAAGAAVWDVSSEPKRVLSLADLRAEAALAAVSDARRLLCFGCSLGTRWT